VAARACGNDRFILQGYDMVREKQAISYHRRGSAANRQTANQP
jgi:hypothetical protein